MTSWHCQHKEKNMSNRVKDPNSYIKGYKAGIEEGRREALIAFQKDNPNKDLPSNEVLYRIFKLLYECEENDRKTCSVYMNYYEHLANYITKNWERDKEIK